MLKEFDDIPMAIQPIYQTAEPNERVLLYDGPFEADIDGSKVSQQGRLFLSWMPRSKLVIECDDPNTDSKWLAIWSSDEPIRIILNTPEAITKAHIIGLTIGSERSMALTLAEPLTVKKDHTCKEMIFHVANFGDHIGKPIRYDDNSSEAARLEYAVGNWMLALDQVPDNSRLFDRLKEESGVCITHVGCLSRSNGKTFSPDDGQKIIDAFRWFLCFCEGKFVGIPFTTGRARSGDRIYERWVPADVTPWTSAPSWLPWGRITETAPLFDAFYQLWKDELFRDPLISALHWYVIANLNVARVEGSVVLAQIAMESLAWTKVVVKDKVISKKGFDKLDADDKFRLLLSALGIPVTIPTTLPKSQAWCAKRGCKDIPEVTVEVRNEIVHPVKHGVPAGVTLEAKFASLWCLELVILRLLGYQGRYSNRLDLRTRESQYVPWVRNND